MFRQRDYRTYTQTFRLSKAAFRALQAEADEFGELEIYREATDDEDGMETHYATDHIYKTTGGDLVRHREYHNAERDEDTYDILGHSQPVDRILLGIYRQEWERQETDDNQFYWFEWREGGGRLPGDFTAKLPYHIERSAEPPTIS